MSDDLLSLAAPITTRLPKSEDDDCFRFEAKSLPSLPSSLETRQLIVKRGQHIYHPSFRVDAPQCYARKAGYEALGVLLATFLVRPARGSLVLHLTHPASEVRRLCLHRPADDPSREGLHLDPTAFVYWVTPALKHPWHEATIDPYDLPWLALTNDADHCNELEDWAERDVIRGFGSPQGLARLAQLLLDMSRESSSITEVALETEGGFRGVAPLSAEIRFWLPGADLCDDADFPRDIG